jgi:hypothetical protein
MATPRQTIADQLIQDYPTKYAVYPYLYAPATNISQPSIAVYRTAVEESGTGLSHPVTIDAYGQKTMGEKVEDELDEMLDDIMLSLQRLERVYEIKATRTVFKDTYQGWSITCSVSSGNVYKSAVLDERS